MQPESAVTSRSSIPPPPLPLTSRLTSRSTSTTDSDDPMQPGGTNDENRDGGDAKKSQRAPKDTSLGGGDPPTASALETTNEPTVSSREKVGERSNQRSVVKDLNPQTSKDSPDTLLLATGSTNGHVRSCPCTCLSPQHRSISFRIICYCNQVCIFDVSSRNDSMTDGKSMWQRLDGHSGKAYGVCFNGSRADTCMLASYGADGSLKVQSSRIRTIVTL